MTNQELMKNGFNQVNQHLDRVDLRLNGMDTRLRTVENSISELKGKQSAMAEMQDWITIACATGAVIISIAVVIFK